MAALDWSTYYSRPSFGGVELLHAGFVRHAFARHWHDFHVIGLVEHGVQRFWHDRAVLVTPPLGIIALNPGEPHTGEAAIESGFVYRALYPSRELMQLVSQEIGAMPGQMPSFVQPRIDDPSIARGLLRAHQTLIGPASTLEGEHALFRALVQLVARYADQGKGRPIHLAEHRAVRRAREFIEAHFRRDISLAELAAAADLSPFHLTRVFHRQLGLPPHAYLESVRIREAQRLIHAGMPFAHIAQETGFSDQSHFTNRFRKLVGVTPGRFAGGVR